MSQVNWRKVVSKTVLTIIIIVVAAPVLLISTLGLALHTGLAGELLRSTIDRFVDADLTYSSIKGSVRRLPKLTVEVNDLLVTYPHERFDSLYANTSSFACEGRGDISDTLFFVKRFDACINLLDLMRLTISVPNAEMYGFKAFLHQYGPGKANWDIFPSSGKDKTKKQGYIPTIMLKHVNIGGDDSRVVFCSHQNAFSAAVDFNKLWVENNENAMDLSMDLMAYAKKGNKGVISAPLRLESTFAARNRFGTFNFLISELEADILGVPLEAGGLMRLRQNATKIKLSASIPNCDIGSLLEKYSNIIPDIADKISTDAKLSVSVESEGVFHPKTQTYPKTSFSIGIPSSSISYAGVVENGILDLELEGVLKDSKVLDLDLKDICLKGYGVDLTASARASDLLGKGLKFSVDLNSKIDIDPLLAFLMGSDRVFDAKGTLDLSVEAKDVMRKHLSVQNIKDAQMRAEINGNLLDVTVPGQNFVASAARPHIELFTMDSQVQEGERALGVVVELDSLESRFNGQLVKGNKISITAQDAVGDITDSTQVPPFSIRILADALVLKGSDSLVVAVTGTDNKLVIKPVPVEDRNVPDIKLESSFEKIFYLSPSNRIALMNVDMKADARKRAPWATSVKKRRDYINSVDVDTSYVPDYLREKEFRSADINFSLAKSFQKILYEWNPSLHFSVSNGLLYFSAYPVQNHVKNLDFLVTPSFAEIKNTTVQSGNSDITLNSRVTGLRRMMTGRGRGMLDLDMGINSRKMDLNEILSTIQASKTARQNITDIEEIQTAEQLRDAFNDTLSTTALKDSASRGYPLIIVPANLNANISVRGDSLKYADLNFNDLSGNLLMKERCLQITDLKAASDVGSASLDAFYSTLSKDSITLGYNLSLYDVTAREVIDLVPKVGETIPILDSFKGIIDFNLTATSKIDTNMNFILPSLSGVAEINGTDLLIEDLTSVRKIAQILRFKDKQVGHIADLNIKALVGDNKIEIFPFVFGVDRYKLALTGSQVFPQDYSYHISVLKSPFPFKLGIMIYGDSYKDIKYRLEKPKYTSTVLPLYDAQVDTLQINLINTIKQIFSRGVNAALEKSRRESQSIARRKETAEDTGLLSAADFEKLELEMIKLQAEDEYEMLGEEIDRILFDL